MERKCRSQQENIFELKEQLAHNQADGKMKLTQYEGNNIVHLIFIVGSHTHIYIVTYLQCLV